jgi:hypothetical protein
VIVSIHSAETARGADPNPSPATRDHLPPSIATTSNHTRTPAAGQRPNRRKRALLWDVPQVFCGPVTISGCPSPLAARGAPRRGNSASEPKAIASPADPASLEPREPHRTSPLARRSGASAPHLLATQRGGRRRSRSAHHSPNHRAAPRTAPPARRYPTTKPHPTHANVSSASFVRAPSAPRLHLRTHTGPEHSAPCSGPPTSV